MWTNSTPYKTEALFSYSFYSKWIRMEMAVYRCLRAVATKGPQTCWLKTTGPVPWWWTRSLGRRQQQRHTPSEILGGTLTSGGGQPSLAPWLAASVPILCLCCHLTFSPCVSISPLHSSIRTAVIKSRTCPSDIIVTRLPPKRLQPSYWVREQTYLWVGNTIWLPAAIYALPCKVVSYVDSKIPKIPLGVQGTPLSVQMSRELWSPPGALQ